MARNRKRAKERRARRPQSVTASARAERDAAPDPIEHASPDVELAEAQMAVGRPEERGEDSAAQEEELEREVEESIASGHGMAAGEPVEEETSGDGGELTSTAHGTVAAPREGLFSRLIGFLQGSWRELQRVQWPDRRQVMQATGVVIGFVIVAGVFLGVADLLAGKLMNYILTGHFK